AEQAHKAQRYQPPQEDGDVGDQGKLQAAEKQKNDHEHGDRGNEEEGVEVGLKVAQQRLLHLFAVNRHDAAGMVGKRLYQLRCPLVGDFNHGRYGGQLRTGVDELTEKERVEQLPAGLVKRGEGLHEGVEKRLEQALVETRPDTFIAEPLSELFFLACRPEPVPAVDLFLLPGLGSGHAAYRLEAEDGALGFELLQLEV